MNRLSVTMSLRLQNISIKTFRHLIIITIRGESETGWLCLGLMRAVFSWKFQFWDRYVRFVSQLLITSQLCLPGININIVRRVRDVCGFHTKRFVSSKPGHPLRREWVGPPGHSNSIVCNQLYTHRRSCCIRTYMFDVSLGKSVHVQNSCKAQNECDRTIGIHALVSP